MVRDFLASRSKPQVPGTLDRQSQMPPYSGVSLVLSRQRGSKVRHGVRKLSEAQMQLMLPAKAHFLGFELTTDVQALADIG